MYCFATGTKVNRSKSIVSFVEVLDDDKAIFSPLFPFKQTKPNGGFKYLGFVLKPNDYLNKDWVWILAKAEKRIYVSGFHWLSRGGTLFLVKFLLEAITIYQMSLSWTLKGVLQ